MTFGFEAADQQPVESVEVDGRQLRAGDRVVLCPRPHGDIMDMALAGQTATIESIEQELEDRVYLAVVLDVDPGRDLGLHRYVGHRFFFRVDEVRPVPESDPKGVP